MTTSTKLSQFEGRDVQRTTVRVTGAGDGLSESLTTAPDEIELEDTRYYVLRGECARVSIETDKNGVTSRVHTIKTQSISPIDAELAEKVLRENAEEVQRRKDEVAGQLRFAEEAAAAEREAADETSSVTDIAAAAAERAKGRPAGGAE
jgi:hypothetical protein